MGRGKNLSSKEILFNSNLGRGSEKIGTDSDSVLYIGNCPVVIENQRGDRLGACEKPLIGTFGASNELLEAKCVKHGDIFKALEEVGERNGFPEFAPVLNLEGMIKESNSGLIKISKPDKKVSGFCPVVIRNQTGDPIGRCKNLISDFCCPEHGNLKDKLAPIKEKSPGFFLYKTLY